MWIADVVNEFLYALGIAIGAFHGVGFVGAPIADQFAGLALAVQPMQQIRVDRDVGDGLAAGKGAGVCPALRTDAAENLF